jgi:hypothetical protein
VSVNLVHANNNNILKYDDEKKKKRIWFLLVLSVFVSIRKKIDSNKKK